MRSTEHEARIRSSFCRVNQCNMPKKTRVPPTRRTRRGQRSGLVTKREAVQEVEVEAEVGELSGNPTKMWPILKADLEGVQSESGVELQQVAVWYAKKRTPEVVPRKRKIIAIQGHAVPPVKWTMRAADDQGSADSAALRQAALPVRRREMRIIRA